MNFEIISLSFQNNKDKGIHFHYIYFFHLKTLTKFIQKKMKRRNLNKK